MVKGIFSVDLFNISFGCMDLYCCRAYSNPEGRVGPFISVEVLMIILGGLADKDGVREKLWTHSNLTLTGLYLSKCFPRQYFLFSDEEINLLYNDHTDNQVQFNETSFLYVTDVFYMPNAERAHAHTHCHKKINQFWGPNLR